MLLTIKSERRKTIPSILVIKILHDISTKKMSLKLSKNSEDNWLDLKSVMDAAQSLSAEIVPAKLFKKIIQIVIEDTEAEKAFLLLPKQDRWFIKAECHVERLDCIVLQSSIIEDTEKLPISVIHYVKRTQESLRTCWRRSGLI